MAEKKAEASFSHYKTTSTQPFVILSADTLVYFKSEFLGKPIDQNQAFSFLKNLSGQTHQVLTAVCLILGRKSETGELEQLKKIREIEISDVTFRDLSDSEIWEYIRTDEPMDKAGAYGIQGAGGTFVSKLNGNLDNVMGLPVKRVQSLLQDMQNEIARLKI